MKKLIGLILSNKITIGSGSELKKLKYGQGNAWYIQPLSSRSTWQARVLCVPDCVCAWARSTGKDRHHLKRSRPILNF